MPSRWSRKAGITRTAPDPACRSASVPIPTPTLATPPPPGKSQPYPGRPPALLLPSAMNGRSTACVEVAAHGKAPQHPVRLDQPRTLGHVAGGPVGTDDEVGADRVCVGDVEPVDVPTVEQGLVGPALEGHGSGVEGGVAQGVIEHEAGDRRAWPGYERPSKHGRTTRRPVGPTTTMSPTSRPGGSGKPRSART